MRQKAVKKAFILYKSLLKPVEKLTDQQRSELFLSVLRYANDIQPDVENLDLAVQILFMQCKDAIDENNEKWNDTRLKNTVNIWKRQFMDQGYSKEDAYKMAYDKVYGDTMVHDGVPGSTEYTVSVSGSVSESVSGSGSVLVSDSVSGSGTGAQAPADGKQPDKQTFKDWLVSLCNDDQVFASAVAEWLTYQKSKQISNTKQQISILAQDLTEAYHGDGEKIRKAVHKAITGNYSRIYLPDDASKQASEPESSANPVPAPEPEPEKPKQTLAEYLNDFLGNGQNGVEPYYQFEVKWIRGDQVCFSYWHDSVLYAKDDCINIDQATISDWPGDTEAEPEPQQEYEYGESLPFE